MKTIIGSLIALFMIASFFSTVNAQPKHKFHKRAFEEKMIDQLNLTEEQETKISDLRSVHRKKIVDFKAELEKAMIDMKDLRDNEDLSRDKMISSVEKINSIKNKMALEKANHRMDVYEHLTDDQKKIWREHEPFREQMGRKFDGNDSGKRKHKRSGPPEEN